MATRVVCLFARRYCFEARMSDKWHHKLLHRYENFLENRFPAAHRVHRQVVDGSKFCYQDLLIYFRVRNGLLTRRKSLRDFSRHELESYMLTPPDIAKLTCIAVVAVLPFTLIFIAIAIALLPRLLLTRHFWSREEYVRFTEVDLKHRRERHYARIVQLLQKRVERLDPRYQTILNALLSEVVVKAQLPTEFGKMLKGFDLFSHHRLNLEKLSGRHKAHLCRSVGIWPIWRPAHRLAHRAHLLLLIDEKLREENLTDLSEEELRKSLYMRQISCGNLSRDEMIRVLDSWCSTTNNVRVDPDDKHCYSFVLHMPIFVQIPKPNKP